MFFFCAGSLPFIITMGKMLLNTVFNLFKIDFLGQVSKINIIIMQRLQKKRTLVNKWK